MRRSILVVVDLNPVEPDASAVSRFLRGDPVASAVPVVVLTDQTSPDEARAELAATADACLPKPSTEDELLALAGRFLGPPRSLSEGDVPTLSAGDTEFAGG